MGIMVLLAVVLLMQGDMFKALRALCFGAAGMTAVALPVVLIWGGVLLMLARKARTHARPYLLAALLYLLAAGVAELVVTTGSPALPLLDYMQRLNSYAIGYGDYLTRGYEWNMTVSYAGGGAIGMLTAWPLWRLLGSVPAIVVLALGILTDLGFLFHVKPKKLLERLKAVTDGMKRRGAEKKRQREEERKRWEEQKALQDAQAAQAQPEAEEKDYSGEWQKFRRPGEAEPEVAAHPGPEAKPVSGGRGRSPVGREPSDYGFQPGDEELRDPYAGQQTQPERRPGILSRFLGSDRPKPMHILDDRRQPERQDYAAYQRPGTRNAPEREAAEQAAPDRSPYQRPA